MEWTRDNRLKLARRIRELSLEIQEEEFRNAKRTLATFPETVESAIKRIMSRLEPLGFERANKDWTILEDHPQSVYLDSKTHLWFETAQGRVVKIHKEHAEKLLVLGIP